MLFACLSVSHMPPTHLCLCMYFYLRCEYIPQIMRPCHIKLIYEECRSQTQSHNSLSFHQQLPRHWTPSSNTCSSSSRCSSTINSSNISSNTITNRPTHTPRISCPPSITWPRPASSKPPSRLQDPRAPPPLGSRSSPHRIDPASLQPAAFLLRSLRPCLYRWVLPNLFSPSLCRPHQNKGGIKLHSAYKKQVHAYDTSKQRSIHKCKWEFWCQPHEHGDVSVERQLILCWSLSSGCTWIDSALLLTLRYSNIPLVAEALKLWSTSNLTTKWEAQFTSGYIWGMPRLSNLRLSLLISRSIFAALPAQPPF